MLGTDRRPGPGKGSSLCPADAEADPSRAGRPLSPTRGQQPAQLSTHGLGGSDRYQPGRRWGNELEIRPPNFLWAPDCRASPPGFRPLPAREEVGVRGQHRRPLRPPGAGVGKQPRPGPGSEGDPWGGPAQHPGPCGGPQEDQARGPPPRRRRQRGPRQRRAGPACPAPGPAWPGLAEAPGRPGRRCSLGGAT